VTIQEVPTAARTILVMLFRVYSLLFSVILPPHLLPKNLHTDVEQHIILKYTYCKRSNPTTGLDRPRGFHAVEVLRFQDNRRMKVVRLSALHTYCCILI